MLPLCVLVALFALAAPANSFQPSAAPDLLLLFKANVSRQCTGQCVLQASTVSCLAALAALSRIDGNASAPADLEEWNSVLVDWQGAQTSSLHISLSCADTACKPMPASFLAWLGAECARSETGADGEQELLPSELMAHNLLGDSYRLYMLNDELPAVNVSFQPSLPATPCPSEGQAQHPLATVNSSAAASTSPALSLPQFSEAVCATGTERHCSSLRVLRLALAAWTLGCATLAGRL